MLMFNKTEILKQRLLKINNHRSILLKYTMINNKIIKLFNKLNKFNRKKLKII